MTARKTLSLADVARYPRPGMTGPRRLGFSPDSRQVTYLASQGETLVQQLWLYDIASGQRHMLTGTQMAAQSEGQLSRDEELRRERSRTRELGVTDYAFATQAIEPVLLVPGGNVLSIRRGDGSLLPLPGSEGALDARLSPDGTQVAFVREGDLHVLATDGHSAARRLTSGAVDGLTNGLAEYIAQEEMGRSAGFWWSPDSRCLAFVQADSRHIARYPIVHQGKDVAETEWHRYPFAGSANAIVRLGCVSATGMATGATTDEDIPITWMDLGQDLDIYLARVAWRLDGTLTAQVESRDQQTLCLLAFDSATGQSTVLLHEQGEPWLNLHDDAHYLESGEFLWSSERTGFRHLYLYASSGTECRALTSGEWVVTRVVLLDQQRRIVYVQGTRDDARQRHLYAVSLDGGEMRRLTETAGWHETVISPDGTLFLDSWNSIDHAPTVTLRRVVDGAVVATLHDAAATATELGLVAPELTSFTTDDGTTLFAAIYAPPGATDLSEDTSRQRYPVIVSVYGGPHAQRVTNQWDLTVDLRAQYLAQEGFIVLKVDNRGSANRGLAFEAALNRAMGQIEVLDQVAGVRFLAQRRSVDAARVGVYGWSYGGYMTCLCLLRAPDTFKVGVAGAPVSDWDGYDTHYTERYMGTPQHDAAAYAASSVLTQVGNLGGTLLLVHGLVDENVHFRHTARLIQALIAAQKPYDLLLFPEERHMPREAQGLEYMERRLTDYFAEHL